MTRATSITAAEQVRLQYVHGERDIQGLEAALAWLMEHDLDESYETISPLWAAEWKPGTLDAVRPR